MSIPVSTERGASAPRGDSWATRNAALPILIFIAALAPRLFDLASRPFWLDEVFTLQRVRMAPAALIHDSLIAHHMPTYFLLLSVLAPLHNPQFWLRLPSAILGALAVMLVFLIGLRVGGRTAGLVAALIFGLSPAAVAFSQEARSYSLVMCLILLALLALTPLAMDVPAASVPLRARSHARRAWMIFIIATIGAVDVLADGFLWLIAANFILGVMVALSPRRKALIGNLLIADLLILLFSVPFYIIMALTITQSFTKSVGWIPPLSGPRLWYNFGSIYLMRIADTVTFALIKVATPAVISWTIDAGLILAVGFAAWRLRRRPEVLALLGFSFLGLPLILTIISLWQPILLPRYILWSAAPFAILAGIGASLALRPLSRPARIAVIGCAGLLLLINLVPYYGAETKPRWDIAGKLLAADYAPGDVVFLDDLYAPAELQVYLPQRQAAAVLKHSVSKMKQALCAQAQGKRVWAVYGIAGQVDYDPGWRDYAARMAPLGKPVEIQRAGRRIYIVLFAPAGQKPPADCPPGAPPPCAD